MSDAALVQCTFVGNTALSGSNISSDCSANITADACIVTGGIGSAGVFIYDNSSVDFTCTDIWGNPQGDWVGAIASQYGQDGNISLDPWFCDPTAHDFTLAAGSPCAPDAIPGCGLVGAWPVACDWPTTAPTAAPGTLVLAPNAPNPFNPSTTIAFDLLRAGAARLSVHALDGRLVTLLVDGSLPAGPHRVTWHGRDRGGRLVPSGTYLYRLTAGGESTARHMTMIR